MLRGLRRLSESLRRRGRVRRLGVGLRSPKMHAANILLLAVCARAQAPWTGDMHPTVTGFTKPTCNLSVTGSCAPSYADLDAAGVLWPCPDGDESPRTCASSATCVPSLDPASGNPLCPKLLNDSSPCCCPAAGCFAEPQFNWIIGVCKGASCACGSTKTTANSCAPQNRSDQCGADCTGAKVPCCFGADVSDLVPYYEEGTHALVNYVAAYQFDVGSQTWRLAADSSFNTDGSRPAFDLLKPYGGLSEADAWLAPQPGGSVFWSLGYYPAGVRGVGPPGMMFVLSTEDWFGGTFYMLNTLAMNRGPGNSYPAAKCKTTNSNCWAAGNSGEMDFLEPGWNNPKTAASDYRQSFSTQDNQIGRCFNGGVNGGGFDSPNYILTENSPLAGAPAEPMLYVAVVDSVGTWVYRIPAADAPTLWPGLGRRVANATVRAAPTRAADSMNPGNTSFGASFTSNCQAKTVADARMQECGFNGDQGWCGNWWMELANTQQPLFPSESCERDVRGGATMPWCKSMVPTRAASACPASARAAGVEEWMVRANGA